MIKDQKKVLFKIPAEDSSAVEIESLWTIPHKDNYKVDNIPFYVYGIAYGDIMSVNTIDGVLYADRLITPSGHSTIRIWLSNEKYLSTTREELASMGCSSEVSNLPQLIAIDIPADIPYRKVKTYLKDGENSGKWEFEEACLGFL